MEWLVLIIVAAAIWYFRRSRARPKVDLTHLPERFIVFDLETTGLDPSNHEIIEIGAIRVNRDSDQHESFQALVKPAGKVPKRITELTGISQAILDGEGDSLNTALREFSEFIGDLRLVSFNADFDMAFLRKAVKKHSIAVTNPVSCALKMTRRAWPGRRSYKLASLAQDGNLSSKDAHRALGDCQRALIVYTAAANKLRTIS